MTVDVDRRRFLKGVGATAAAGAALGYPGGPVQRAAASDLSNAASSFVIGGPIGYAVRYVEEKYTGDDFDEKAYEETEAEETHAGIREKGIEMAYYDDSTLTNLENVLANSEKVAYSDARYAAIEAMNLGDDESEVIDAAEAEVDDFFAVQQENLFEHFSVQIEKMERMVSTVNDTDSLSEDDVFVFTTNEDDERDPSLANFESTDYEFVDGSNYSYERYWNDGYEEFDPSTAPDSNLNGEMEVKPVDDGSTELIMDVVRFSEVAEEIEDRHSTVVDEITTFIEEVYPDYEEGDIDLEDVVSGSELADMASEDQENPIAGADLAAMGLSSNVEASMEVELVEDELTFEGSIYMMNAPEDGLEVGETYDPADYDGPVYLAYADYDGDSTLEDEDGNEVELDESGLIEVSQDFEILTALGEDGEALDSVEYSDPADQSTTTTDTDELNDELDRLAELQSDLEEKQKRIAEQSGGGGGGSGGFDISTEGKIVIAAAGVLAFLGITN